MKNLKGTRTEQNLKAAFAGESQARNKYTFYSNIAKKQGYVHLAKIFEETANNEKAHAKIWFKLLQGGSLGDTLENLEDASKSENYEWTEMYPTFAKEAKEEGFDDIAFLFSEVAKIERFHDKRYLKLMDELKNKKIFHRDTEQIWECSVCGYHAINDSAPEICPVCKHPQAYFFVQDCTA